MSHRLVRLDRCSARPSAHQDAHRTTVLTVERCPKNHLIFCATQRRLSNTPPFFVTQVNLAPMAAHALIPTFGKTVTKLKEVTPLVRFVQAATWHAYMHYSSPLW